MGAYFDLPSVTLTREQFNIKPSSIVKKERIRARVSGFMDVNSKFILVTKITEKSVKRSFLSNGIFR